MPFINDLLAENQQHNEQQAPRTRAHASRFLFEPLRVMQLLQQRIIGQDDALAEISDSLAVVKAELGDPRKPLGVFLLLGPTGVGKTETVRLLAEAIHGRADALCRIDMNTLAQEHYAASLTGAPPGYVGSKEGTTLFDREAIEGSFGRPGLVLFDELEKASDPVIRALMNIFDNGQLRLSAGNSTLDFRNSLIFLTSNLGASSVQQLEQGWARLLPPRWRSSLQQRVQRRALQQRFDPEFLNRLDHRIRYRSLHSSQLQHLVELALAQLNQRLARHQVQLALDAELRDWLAARGHDHRFGARAMARSFRHHLEPVVARALLNAEVPPVGSLLRASLNAGEVQVRIEPPPV
ncbi:AAA family ATPase [Halopseudomonas oceani]|uniref:AAA family ATPase n=1 Tax=Halopseudomonas oceani TaxID=1708783 RepID=UPI002AA717F1|nr:AAA family ATPase [Halopseudomonas oceani]